MNSLPIPQVTWMWSLNSPNNTLLRLSLLDYCLSLQLATMNSGSSCVLREYMQKCDTYYIMQEGVYNVNVKRNRTTWSTTDDVLHTRIDCCDEILKHHLVHLCKNKIRKRQRCRYGWKRLRKCLRKIAVQLNIQDIRVFHLIWLFLSDNPRTSQKTVRWEHAISSNSDVFPPPPFVNEQRDHWAFLSSRLDFTRLQPFWR